ncbi:MAG: type IV pilus secretin PilQ [Myxococcota bacterium]|nr:type IV pilus secretin PilQ [Myxococcota bacterium]
MSNFARTIRTFAVTAALAVSFAAAPLLVGDAMAADVEGVEIVPGEETLVYIYMTEGSDGAAVSTFSMTDPHRIIVDIADVRAVDGLEEMSGEGGLIDEVLVSTIEDEAGVITRAEIFLTKAADHTFSVSGNRIDIAIEGGTAAAPAVAVESDPMGEALDDDPIGDALGDRSPPVVYSDEPLGDSDRRRSGPDSLVEGATLTSLDFEYSQETNTVVIGAANIDDVLDSRPNPKTVLIDVPGAYVPKSLRRVLDTGDFISPIRMVRAYSTSKGARIAISLRTATDYDVTRTASGVAVRFAVPPALQEEYVAARTADTQEFGAVGPSQSDGPIRNAYQEEIVIGAAGRTVSPSSAWGMGGGAANPASLLGMASGFQIDSSSAATVPYSGRRISLDFVNADIHSIFRLISHVSRLNIVSGDDVSGRVTVRMVDVPWDQALAAVLQAKGLGSQRFGNIVRVAPIETIKAEQQAALEAKRAQDELADLSVLVVPLDYASAPALAGQVENLLGDRGKIQMDERGNQLIVQETESRLAQIRELIRHLDKQTPQVMIEARVVEASSVYIKSFGIQWGGEMDASTATGYSTGLFFPNNVGMSGGMSRQGAPVFYSANQPNLLVDLPSSGSTGSVAFHLGSIPGLVDLDARLSAMESDGWGKVISSPRVTTVDNASATILQGQKIPYMSTSAGGTQVKYINAALDLTVTPHITTDNKVKLEVAVKNDRADFSVLVQGQPAISIKQVNTELLVQSGDTTVIGGVFATDESMSKSMVPGLSRVPLLGFLFKNSTMNRKRNELLIFITPRIVTRSIVSTE